MNPRETRDRGDGWPTVCLEAVGSILTGHPFKSDAFTNSPTEGGLPLVRIRDVLVGRSFTYVAGSIDHETRRRYLVKDGDVLIGMDGQFHVSEWRGGEALLNQRVAKVAFDDAMVDPVFGYYSLLAPVRLIEAGKHYTTVKHLSMSDLRSLEIPLPSLPEQRAIAQVLRTVQRAKEATEQVISAAQELKKSLIRHLFTYGVESDPATKSVEFGEVPADWAMVPLGDLSTVIRGSSPRPKGNPKYFSTSATEYPWIMISDLRKYQRGKVLMRTDEYLTAAGKDKGRFIKSGTLVLTNSGTVGKPAILGFDGCIHDGYLAFLELDESMDQTYLYFLFQYLQDHLLSLAPRGTQANLNTRILKGLHVPVPPELTQKFIGGTLTTIDEKVAAEKARRDALASLFDSLLHDLMTARLRVGPEVVA